MSDKEQWYHVVNYNDSEYMLADYDCEIMTLKGEPWIKGLPLNADAFQTDYYLKD